MEFRVVGSDDLNMEDFDLEDSKLNISHKRIRERLGFSPSIVFPNSTELEKGEKGRYYIRWRGTLSAKEFGKVEFSFPKVGSDLNYLGTDDKLAVTAKGIALRDWQSLAVNLITGEFSLIAPKQFNDLVLRDYKVLGYIDGESKEFITSCGKSFSFKYLDLRRGWDNQNEGYLNFSASLKGERVTLEGEITGTGGLPFELPPLLRPRRMIGFRISTESGDAKLEINPDGVCEIVPIIKFGWVSLAGISYTLSGN